MSVRLQVPDADDPDFVAELVLGPEAELERAGEHGAAGKAELRLTGSADGAASGGLATLLDQVHRALCAHRCRDVVVDMTSLEVMAAACFNQLVEWVALLQELDHEQRYRIRFRTNPSILWQKHSLDALSCFDTDIVTIES